MQADVDSTILDLEEWQRKATASSAAAKQLRRQVTDQRRTLERSK